MSIQTLIENYEKHLDRNWTRSRPDVMAVERFDMEAQKSVPLKSIHDRRPLNSGVYVPSDKRRPDDKPDACRTEANRDIEGFFLLVFLAPETVSSPNGKRYLSLVSW